MGWIKWHTPRREQSVVITLESKRDTLILLDENGDQCEKLIINADIAKVKESTPPDPQVSDTRPSWQKIYSQSSVQDRISEYVSNNSLQELSWYTWSIGASWTQHWDWTDKRVSVITGGMTDPSSDTPYWDAETKTEDITFTSWGVDNHYFASATAERMSGKFYTGAVLISKADLQLEKVTYSVSMSAEATISPSDYCKTATYSESNGKYTMKSGYGIQINVDTHLSGDTQYCTGSQTANVLFPEFNYNRHNTTLYNRLLEKVNGSFVFKKNKYSTYNDRVHFTPIWFPDKKNYTVYVEVFDVWCPAGQLSVRLTDQIYIKGNVYDDWHIAPVKPSIPVPYGQGQHGTTWFMSEKEKKEVFDYIKISPMNPLVSKLVALGKERYEAIENGEEYTPPKLDKTLCKSGGIVLAREMSGDTECLPCITDDIHTLTIGATRSGKSRCLVLQSICTIALAGEGIVVNDPKGELYHYTHCYLESLGYTVRVVDFNSPQKSSHYNPLQVIIDDVNKGNLDAAQRSMWDFVTFLVEKNDHTEPIWTNGECAVIAAAVMCVVYDNKDHPEFQNLTNVYNFIANMCKTVNKVMPIDAYMNKLPDSHPAKSLMAIAKIAPDKMGGSFFTSALTTLRLYITNDMYNVTKESEFSLEDMGAKPKQALFYLLPDQKTTYYPIVSLLVAQQYEQLVTYAKTRGNRLPNRVNFILDEFGNFTAIPDIQSKMTVGGGYGIRWNLFIQDFNQLIDKYGQEVAKIIQSNCHFWIYLHSQDNSTNKEISDRLGKYTTSTYSLGGTTQKYAAPSSSTNIQLSERSLLFPDEVALIQRPYQIVTSIYKPVVMKSPDISQWMFNIMLGMGDKAHNTKLIDLDEKLRPERGTAFTEQILWKPWEEILQTSAPVQAASPRFSEPGLHNKPPYFRKG